MQQLHSVPSPKHIVTSPRNPMAGVSKADAAVALFSLVIAVAAPLIDSQVVLPQHLYPAPLVSVFQWFVDEFDHYLLAGRPPFLRSFVWLALTFLWPVCIANLYGILARRRWVAAATTLMVGVTMLTYLVTIDLPPVFFNSSS